MLGLVVDALLAEDGSRSAGNHFIHGFLYSLLLVLHELLELC